MNHSDSIGEHIRILRVTKGLSQEKLALSAGITPSYIGQIERNERNPTVRILEKICCALDISLLELLSVAKGDGSQINYNRYQSSDEIRQVILEVLRDTNMLGDSSDQSPRQKG